MEKILEIINELQKELDEEYRYLRSEAYVVRIEDDYAIELRDKFNNNAGKYDMLMTIKNKIKELKVKE